MQHQPEARTEGIVVERVDDELVVYDELSKLAHCLSSEAAAVWEHCDGRHSEADIAQSVDLAQTIVARALSELSEKGLLGEGALSGGGYSRREAGKRLAKIGGAAFAAPLIYSVAIGPAIAAASTCSMNSQCAGRPNVASAQCSGGTCEITACDAGFADCDLVFANGCETNTNTDSQHCGSCENACTAEQICADGECVAA
jgi:hypothetical protein